MKVFGVTFMAVICSVSGVKAAGPRPAPYTAVEIDRFVPVRGVAFPPIIKARWWKTSLAKSAWRLRRS